MKKIIVPLILILFPIIVICGPFGDEVNQNTIMPDSTWENITVTDSGYIDKLVSDFLNVGDSINVNQALIYSLKYRALVLVDTSKNEDISTYDELTDTSAIIFRLINGNCYLECINSYGDAQFVVDTNGNYGVNNDDPDEILDLYSIDDYGQPSFTTFSSSNKYTQIRLQKSETNVDTLKETTDGNILGQFVIRGCDSGDELDVGAAITVTQDGSSSSKVPCKMDFFTCSSTSTNSNQLVLASNGSIGIGTASINANTAIHVSASEDTTMYFKWASGVDALIGRGESDTDITYIMLRNADGEACYLYPNADQDGIVVTDTKP